jgi:hypothetical protein
MIAAHMHCHELDDMLHPKYLPAGPIRVLLPTPIATITPQTPPQISPPELPLSADTTYESLVRSFSELQDWWSGWLHARERESDS